MHSLHVRRLTASLPLSGLLSFFIIRHIFLLFEIIISLRSPKDKPKFPLALLSTNILKNIRSQYLAANKAYRVKTYEHILLKVLENDAILVSLCQLSLLRDKRHCVSEVMQPRGENKQVKIFITTFSKPV